MKIADESEWQGLLAELATDSNQQLAQGFRGFVVAWAEAAEKRLDQVQWADDNRQPTADVSPIDALRTTLRPLEQRIGRWTVGFLGQALLILGHHWAPAAVNRTAFFNSLTAIEQNLFLDVAAAWLDLNSEKADQRG